MSEYLVWGFLNVLLPAALAPVGYFIAMLAAPGLDVDHLLTKSFRSGELFAVAFVLMAVLVYDVFEHEVLKGRHLLSTLSNIVFFGLALIFFLLFICAKFMYFNIDPSPETELWQHYLSIAGIGALALTCLIALLAKPVLISSRNKGPDYDG